MFKKIVIAIGVLIIIAGVGGYVYLRSTAPTYNGEISISGIKSDVEIKFDNFGIPHIYAQNDEDCYKALGYVHAQDRLFQMEMVKRLSSGRLSEILGPSMIDADKYFRTLGLRKMAEHTADVMKTEGTPEMHRQVNAYLSGINEYINNGNTPIEYHLIGIPKEEFIVADIYTILGYMGLGFTLAIKEEPIIDQIYQKYGAKYLEDWQFNKSYLQGVSAGDSTKDLSNVFTKDTEYHLNSVGLPIWEGSNGWVVAPEKSESGEVIFANDTHIGISQPSVWYEAHLNYPGFEFYGNYLAGVPFGVIGHNRSVSFGLTIFPFDVVDMYRERLNPDNNNQVWVDDHWEDMLLQEEIIKVKGEPDVTITRKVTRHGPIINEVSPILKESEKEPISLWWNFLEQPSPTLIALHELNKAQNIDDARAGVQKIDFIGLNVLYGDKEGNIAHWGAGKIPKRAPHVLSKYILDGASGKDELLGYYDFSENPQFENPESGFVASANNDPGIFGGNYFQGYYCTDNRYNRIVHHLTSQEKWSQEDMKLIQLDNISDDHKEISQIVTKVLLKSVNTDKSTLKYKVVDILNNWDGTYTLDGVAPTVYTKLIYHCMRLCIADEMGLGNFSTIQSSYLYKGSIMNLLENEDSPWWQDVSTNSSVSSRDMIFSSALNSTINELVDQLGKDPNKWTWNKVHTIEHVHPIGRKKPFDKFFNVGPFPVTSGNDVPNKMMYTVDSTGLYKTYSSPALRILIDFADIEASESITPTGQSGNPMSKHYDDQAEMFVNGVYRPQLMNHEEIEKKSSVLLLKPK
jgi:penicillin amidase